jgi:hypothetical protein
LRTTSKATKKASKKREELEVPELVEPNEPKYNEFLNDLGFKESTDRYDEVNEFGFMGRYQMGYEALEEAGFYDNGWTDLANQYGVFSQHDFLKNPIAQDAAIKAFHSVIFNVRLYNYGMHDYVGTTMNGVLITESGLLAASHLVGAGRLSRALNDNNLHYATDANGVSAADYMKLFGGYNIDEIKKE